ncbi:hypothetical protein G6F46_014246 [Rhizopus delemar]|nr:hypothetical protein G6F46_014246 [Rhizopus delemar]
MAAEAALRAGAGLLSLGTRRDHVGPLLARLPEAMTHALEDGDALPALLDRATVVAIGPGLGQDEWARALIRERCPAPSLPRTRARPRACLVAAALTSRPTAMPARRRWPSASTPWSC